MRSRSSQRTEQRPQDHHSIVSADAFPPLPRRQRPAQKLRLVHRDRVRLLLAATTYSAVYVLAYVWFVEPLYEAWGLGLRADLSWVEIAGLWFIAVLPATLFPRSGLRPSDFLLAVQYLLIYIPSLWVALNATRPQLARVDAWLLVLTLLVAMTLQLVVRRTLAIPAIRLRPLSHAAYRNWLWVVSAAFLGYLAITLGANFQLVSLDDIYDLRTASSEILSNTGSSLGAYLLNWTSAVLLPLAIAIGLYRNRMRWIVAAIGAYVFLFGVWGSKAFLLAPLMLLGVHLLIRSRPRILLNSLIRVLIVLLLAPTLFIPWGDELGGFLSGWYVHLVHQRTFSSSALLIPQYLDFFSVQPNTLGSHVSGVNLFVRYPFDMDVPRTVGTFHYGGPMTANVNYWAQDGIAAFGLAGVPVIAALASLVYWLLDWASARLDPRLATASVSFVAMNLADTSLFTSLVTGGLALLIAGLAVMPNNASRRLKSAASVSPSS
jgi:hypothetical protein